MRKMFSVIILIFFTQSAFSQLKKYNYKSKREPNSSLLEKDYNSTIEKMQDGRIIFKFYYPENNMITSFYTLKSKESTIKHGLSYGQTDEGQLLTKGSYYDNEKDGYWIEHDSEGVYKSGVKDGKWITRNGNNIVREENYFYGKLSGDYFEYDKSGNIIIQRQYIDGKVRNEQIDSTYYIHKTPARYNACNDKNLTEQDLIECSTTTMLRFIYSKLNYPRKARKQNIFGTALAILTIEKDGSISNIKMQRSLSIDIKEECISVLSMMPNWIPATENNLPVVSNVEIPIRFELN